VGAVGKESHYVMSKKKNATGLTPRLRFPEFHEAGAWAVVPLASLCEINPTYEKLPDSFTYIDLECVDEGVLNQRNQISLEDAPSRAQRLLKSGDVIYQLVRPYQRNNLHFRHDDGPYVASTGYAQLRAREDAVFLYQLIHTDTFVDDVLARCTGSSYPAITSGELGAITVASPPDAAEQRKIAACLGSLDDLIAAESRKLAVLRRHKTGLMQQIFPRPGETRPRLRFPEFRKAGEWKQRKLSDIGSISSGTTPARSESRFFEGGTVPWVKTTDLNNSVIENTEESVTEAAKVRINPAGSVLIAMYGGFKQIGRTGMLAMPAATNQALSVINVDRDQLEPQFVLAWLNAMVRVWKTIASSSRKDPNITGSDVAAFPISFPKPDEQNRIADCLAALDVRLSSQAVRLEALREHKRGLMQQLFPTPEAG
jgi:type I restriction enzyme S subunit